MLAMIACCLIIYGFWDLALVDPIIVTQTTTLKFGQISRDIEGQQQHS